MTARPSSTEAARQRVTQLIAAGVVAWADEGRTADRYPIPPWTVYAEIADKILVALRESPDDTPLRSFAQWIVALDEPGATERRTVTMTQIIEQARAALAAACGDAPAAEETP